MATLGLFCPSPSLALPERGVRASRMVDLLRVLKIADHDVRLHPELVAASVALTHQVDRVVLSADPSHIQNDSHDIEARVALTAPASADTFAGPTHPAWSWVEDSPSALTFAAVEPPLQAPDPVWRRRGLYLVPGRAEALIPQSPRRVPISPAVLAAVLYLTGRPALLPTIELSPGVTPLDDLIDLGLCPLALRGPARRVGRGAGFPARRPPPDAPPRTDAPSKTDVALPPELSPLRTALLALCERWSYRLPEGEAGMRTLDREANKVLQAEVAAGRIKGYALAITPLGDDLQDLGMEVVVTLPRRVGQVILRLSPMPPRP